MLCLSLTILARTHGGLQTNPSARIFPIREVQPVTRLVDYEPYWSPDGRKIVLISNRHGPLKVHVLRVDDPSENGSTMKQLTFGSDEDDTPVYSPDGRRIAFVSIRKGVSQICVMNQDGSAITQITHGAWNNIHPAWSPDGSRLLFNTLRYESENRAAKGIISGPRPIGEAIDAYMELATTRPNGTDWRRITHGGGYTYAFYSPDGRSIVYRRTLPDGSEIHVMGADGQGDVGVSGASRQDGWPSWAPDGRRICFVRQVNSSLQIFVINRDGTGLVQVTDALGDFTNPRWGPRGKAILCTRRLGGIALILLPAPP